MPTDTSFLKIRRKFDQIFIKLFYIKIWKNYYFCLCWGAAVTTGLAYTQWFVGYAVVGVLITYFTDTWKEQNLPNAVAMINLLEGSSSVLGLVMTYISDNHVRPLKVILYSTAAYIIGMVMLCISAFHPIPGDMTGKYFVPAVLLMAVGKAGGVPILEGFLVGQLRAHEPRQLDKDEGRVNARKNVWWITASVVCALSTPWIFGNVQAGWRKTFICSVSVMGIGYLLFLCCIPLYHRSVDEADATSEISRASPEENINNGPTLAVSAGRSRSADEAATTSEISRASPEENTNNGPTPAVSAGRRLKEQWKPLSIMIPMWTTFLVFGLVLSTGDTFFTEQGNNMYATVSIYKLNMIRFIIKNTLSSHFSTLLLKHVPKPQKTKSIIVLIWMAMVVSVFCCSIAWRVEIRRLHAITEYGLCANKDDLAVIPTSILLLAPQFCLLGLMEGIGKQGLNLLFESQVSNVPMDKYGSALNEAVIGFGSFLNAVLVYRLKSWFGDSLNCSSRLDNYYQMLTVLSFVNLCYYWFVSTLYWNKKTTKDDIGGNQETVIEVVVV